MMGASVCVEAGAIGEISVPSFQFFCEPKTALKKIKSFYQHLVHLKLT